VYKIALVNMPFVGLELPSLALTQLKSVVDAALGDRATTSIFYLNHDVARSIGVDLSEMISTSAEAQNAGLGDWFFRQVAFPDAPDNGDVYLRRFFPLRTPQIEAFKGRILEARRSLPALLDELIDAYGLDRADLVGFTSMFSQNVACFAMARRLKQRNPKVLVVMGGANCEPPMGQEIARNIAAVDFVFSGPGLKTFPEFVRLCIEGETDKCRGLRGVFSRATSLLPVTGLQAMGEELDINVPIPLDFQEFLSTFQDKLGDTSLKPVLLFETSRGCWWGERAHCTFCGLNGTTMNYRAMAGPIALRQFDSLFGYAPRVRRIESVDNILPREYLSDVLPHLKTPESMHIFYEVKADLSDDDLRTLAQARVAHIQPGIEALATSTLKLMKKGTTAFQNVALLKGCALHGISPAWNLLIGFPGEEEEVYRKYVADLPLLVHLPPPNGVFPVRFDRYSPYFVQAKAYQLDLHPAEYYEMIYPLGAEAVTNLAYHFADRAEGAPYVLHASKWISKLRKAIAQWRSGWHENGAAPRLFFKHNGEADIVHDTRSGRLVEHAVGPVGRRVLDHLATPKRLSDLAAAWDGAPGIDPAREVSALQERGLLFQEGERYLSLVLRGEPGAPLATH
jgi:ribosomal peptide maturation radical SAM protein 1